MASSSFVYIAANADRRLYVGVAKDLEFAMYLHKRGDVPARLRRKGVDRLVYSEELDSLAEALARQAAIRKMGRQRRAGLIEARNPDWRDISRVPAPVPAGPPGGHSMPDEESGGGVHVVAGPRATPPRLAADAKALPAPVE